MQDRRSTVQLLVGDRYRIDVLPLLGKWAVVVYELPGESIVTDDLYPDRWQAVARAHDFRRLLEMGARKAA